MRQLTFLVYGPTGTSFPMLHVLPWGRIFTLRQLLLWVQRASACGVIRVTSIRRDLDHRRWRDELHHWRWRSVHSWCCLTLRTQQVLTPRKTQLARARRTRSLVLVSNTSRQRFPCLMWHQHLRCTTLRQTAPVVYAAPVLMVGCLASVLAVIAISAPVVVYIASCTRFQLRNRDVVVHSSFGRKHYRLPLQLTCSASADCTGSATPMCCGGVCVAMSCGGGSFTPDAAFDSFWDSVKSMTGK